MLWAVTAAAKVKLKYLVGEEGVGWDWGKLPGMFLHKLNK